MAEGSWTKVSSTQFMEHLSACIIDINASTRLGGQLMAAATMEMGLTRTYKRSVRDANGQILYSYIPLET